MVEPALQHDACHISSISKITSRRANGQVSLGGPGCPRSARINAACIFRIRQNRSLFSLARLPATPRCRLSVKCQEQCPIDVLQIVVASVLRIGPRSPA